MSRKVSTTQPIRWNKDTQEFEYRCEPCKAKNSRYFWPLTEEFWDFKRGFVRCNACERERKAKFEREKRARDPEYRARCVALTKEIRKVKGHIYQETRKLKKAG